MYNIANQKLTIRMSRSRGGTGGTDPQENHNIGFLKNSVMDPPPEAIGPIRVRLLLKVSP